MNICHIVWGMSLGGTENMLVDIINKQVKYFLIVLIVVDKGYDIALLSRLDPRVKVFLLNRTPGNICLFSIFRLNLILLNQKFDIVHCHTPSLLKMVFIRALIQAKICCTVHDTNIEGFNLSKYDKIWSISQAVKLDILNRYNLKSDVVENGIDFSSVKFHTNNTFQNDEFSIVQVSRLDHRKKGQKLLIDALYSLISIHKLNNITVTFIGDGPSKDYLLKYAKELNISSKCQFLGSKNRDYIYSTLKDYDLLVQPSLYEGFGLTITEGIAAMTPVLVSDVEGPADIIQHGEYGYMFNRGDSTDLAMKILQIMEDRQKPGFNKILEANFNYAQNRFDISNTVESYNCEYTKLFANT